MQTRILTHTHTHTDAQKTFLGRVCVKFAQNGGHEKATEKPHKKNTKNAQPLFLQADEGHQKATQKSTKR